MRENARPHIHPYIRTPHTPIPSIPFSIFAGSKAFFARAKGHGDDYMYADVWKDVTCVCDCLYARYAFARMSKNGIYAWSSEAAIGKVIIANSQFFIPFCSVLLFLFSFHDWPLMSMNQHHNNKQQQPQRERKGKGRRGKHNKQRQTDRKKREQKRDMNAMLFQPPPVHSPMLIWQCLLTTECSWNRETMHYNDTHSIRKKEKNGCEGEEPRKNQIIRWVK